MRITFNIGMIVLCCLFLVIGCRDKSDVNGNPIGSAIEIRTDVSARVPLGALISFSTAQPCRVSYTVQGPVPASVQGKVYDRIHEVQLIGLYPDTLNSVDLILTTASGESFDTAIRVQTPALPEYMPEIDVVKADREKMEAGWHLIELLIANNGTFETFTVIFDDDGVIRWFMDMSETQALAYSPLRISSGNWLYMRFQEYFELDDLGRIVRKAIVPGYALDHEILEVKPGQFIMGATRSDSRIIRDGQQVTSRFDHVVEWDKEQNRITWEWDLRKVLDVDRQIFPADYSLDPRSDWFHINSVAVSEADNTIVVSGRNQGVVKMDRDNNPVWILAPHRGWGRAGFDGRGLVTSEYLLDAVDASGNPYGGDVQSGSAYTDDFQWPTGQHALTVLDNGNLLMFDNGLAPGFDFKNRFSRAVEYEIDERNKTIRQVWQYGKDMGLNFFSGVTSNAEQLENGNRLITSGNIRLGELPPHAKIVEVTYPDNTVVFEANVFFKDAKGTQAQEWAQFDLVYRGHRYDLARSN